MSGDELKAEVDLLPWYHRIELPGGIVTPGWAPLDASFYKLPEDMTGMRVLDVGAWDGYWTFEALKRGADYLRAIDDFSNTIHEGERRGWKQFDLCKTALGYQHRCDRLEMSVYDVDKHHQRYDVIFFFGVLYHLKHPLLALEKLHAVLKPGGLLCVESAICDDYSPYRQGGNGDTMVMEFYPEDQLGLNPTNWWAPTLRTLACMMRVSGFEQVTSWKIDQPQAPVECRGFVQGRKT